MNIDQLEYYLQNLDSLRAIINDIISDEITGFTGDGTNYLDVKHNNLADLQGGSTTERQHLTTAQHTQLLDTSTLVVDNTQHRVGVNTAAPTVPLDVTGAAKISGVVAIGDNITITSDGTSNRIVLVDEDLLLGCGTDKTLVLSETVWDDLPPSPIIGGNTGASTPTLAQFVEDTVQYTFDASTDICHGATEITHRYKEGTTIYPHIHWASNGTAGEDRHVKFQLKYCTISAGGVASAQSTTVVSVTIPANTLSLTCFISDFETPITGTNRKVGDYICWKFQRITATGTAPSANPFVLAIGFHIECDTIGSRTKIAK